MKDILSAIWQAASTLLGLAVFAAVMWWVAKTHSRMWRQFSTVYPKRSPAPAAAKKFLDTIVITRRGASWPLLTGNLEFRQYAGARIAVQGKGLCISLLPPFNVLCPPLELPFDEMEVRRTDWALWPEPFALQMRRQTGFDIVLGRDTIQWIRRHTDDSPFGSEG